MTLKNKFILLLLALIIAASAAVWAAPGLIRGRIVSELSNTFKDAKVTAGPIKLSLPLALTLSDITVKSDGYQVTIPQITVDHKLKIILREPRVLIRKYRPAQTQTPAAVPAQARKSGPFSPRRVEALDLVIELKLPNIKGEIRGSVECDFRNYQVNYARLASASLRSGELKIEELALDLPGSGKAGTLTAERLTLGKLKVTGLRGEVNWEDTLITVNAISASWVKGAAAGHARLSAQEPFSYSAELELRELDLDTFSKEFKLDNKMSADGKLAGKMTVEGDRSGLSRLEGRFDAGAEGGDLVIRDEDFLKYLAENTRQPMAIVEAAFRDYHYDTGAVVMQKTERKLGMTVNLNGAKGRRDFEINLHDIL